MSENVIIFLFATYNLLKMQIGTLLPEAENWE